MSTAYACSRRPLASTLAATGSSSTTRILIGASISEGRHLQTLGDLLLDLSRVPGCLFSRVSAAAKRVVPLPVRQLRQPLARPAELLRRHGGDDVAVDALVIELDSAVVDALNKRLLFKPGQIVSGALAEAAQPEPLEHSGIRELAERGPEV